MAMEKHFPTSYMRLRTILDALVVNTLRHCLDGGDADECMIRMEKIEGELLEMVKQVGGDAPCDMGYFNCGGVCVPYACFEEFVASAE
jgi:hypothetical protein